jgi:16S rRNA (cytosine1402-N4)-methyltransferase
MDPASGHIPVLRGEVVSLLSPLGRSVLVDCTLGLGGHAEALLEASDARTHLIGIDADASNLALAKQRLEPFGDRVRFFHANFSQLPDVLEAANVDRVDGILADLGVSSTQLDEAERGFSFAAEAPLDMRMDRESPQTAADLVNTLDETELADLIYQYGEERYSRRVARQIVAARLEKRIETTTQLAELVSRAYPPMARKSRRGVHPATRTFQALRIAVNQELSSLDILLKLLPQVLASGGRAAIISFHSLEDRRVKQAFASLARQAVAELLTRKPLVAGEEEMAANPRSRSAKLRALEMKPIPSGWVPQEMES